MRDMLLIAAGLVGIYAELLRPGKVIPGVVGGVLLTLGLAGLARGPIEWSAVLWLGTPLVLLTAGLLAIAWRARRNKISNAQLR